MLPTYTFHRRMNQAASKNVSEFCPTHLHPLPKRCRFRGYTDNSEYNVYLIWAWVFVGGPPICNHIDKVARTCNYIQYLLSNPVNKYNNLSITDISGQKILSIWKLQKTPGCRLDSGFRVFGFGGLSCRRSENCQFWSVWPLTRRIHFRLFSKGKLRWDVVIFYSKERTVWAFLPMEPLPFLQRPNHFQKSCVRKFRASFSGTTCDLN